MNEAEPIRKTATTCKISKKAAMLLTLMLVISLLASCGKSEEKVATSSETAPVESVQSLSEQLDALKSGKYGYLRTFVDDNIAQAPQETADQMVQALLDASQDALKAGTEIIYSEQADSLQSAISGAVDMQTVTLISGKEKSALVSNMGDGEEVETLADNLASGLCLRSAEGSWYFVIDYPEYNAAYGQYLGDELAGALSIMADETTDPLTRSEYLVVDPMTLGERAVAYETYLSQYSSSKNAGAIRDLLFTAVWKLAFPSPVENLTDDKGCVKEELKSVYETLAKEDKCPVLQEVARSMLDYIAAQPDGVVATIDNTDALSTNADHVNGQAKSKIAQLYGE